MKGKFFLDTHIFIYSFDNTMPVKQRKARQLIQAALSENRGCISYQVVQEFINAAVKKFAAPLSVMDCQRYLNYVLAPLCQVYSSVDLYCQALDFMQRWHFSFYDSLIVTAACNADCRILYSEDLQHGQSINALKIVNPFL